MDEATAHPPRAVNLSAFLDRAGWGDATHQPMSADASFRRYIRLRHGTRRALVMDAPPPHERVGPFIQVDRHLQNLGFSVPTLLAEDAENGFLLLEDFGDATFTNLLAAGADEENLYTLATDTLVALHRSPSAIAPWLDPYDADTLYQEAALLIDWFVPAHNLPLARPAQRDYEHIWRGLFETVLSGPKTLVLRDFHVDNLMHLDDRNGIRACGVLDFQDALAGHPAYDLMSLLQDARRDVDATLQTALKTRYRQALNFSRDAWEEFDRAYRILAAQRHAKVIGIFTRLDRRDAKPVYLKHIDRLWRLFEHALDHPMMADLKTWINHHIPPDKRHPPEARS